MNNYRLDRRSFLTTAAATGGALLAAPFVHCADADETTLPMLTVESKDPALPGTWNILDRSKPIRKIVDRKSLVPVEKRSLVLMESRMSFVFEKKSDRCYLVLPLPGDVGNEQTLLGVLPSVRLEKDTKVEWEVEFFQAPGPGIRVAQVSISDCPADLTVAVTLSCVLLQPPILSDAQRKEAAATLSKRQIKRMDWSKTPGFPPNSVPGSFTEGGLKWINAAEGATPMQTIVNVMKAAHGLVAFNDADPQYLTLNPDTAKENRRGPTVARARAAEKGLIGVARAFFVSTYDQAYLTEGLTSRSGMLLIEDPETGEYFAAEVLRGEPYLGPLSGQYHVLGGMLNDGLPNPHNLRYDPSMGIPNRVFSSARPRRIKTIELSGSSSAGKEMPKYQALLKKVPEEFRALQEKLLKG